uniref:Dynein axonemal assembly factor 1 homolog n=1 Tax=Diabrotica virgifera virgifera TaxID=50390 RepID=A0A6P7GVX6_DIAVI
MPVPSQEETNNVNQPEGNQATTSNNAADGDHNEGNRGPTTNDITIIDPECLELDLNHGRVDKLQNFEPLTCIERLYLRWNLITKIENLDTLTTLIELELYDNQITKIENLGCLVNLEILDLSFNRIKSHRGIRQFGQAEETLSFFK